ncbi:hypothetical protein EDD18DRAFT_1120501 [Armillaria luteobubalina]|uniref:Uncharacterized protein n=1 Tax=Armillaria luteobubalina TaxID=153913 RepID=A0AA39QPI4_9AGAR|nr:hypothetical protein EDD18DRAFT_1120501 [Armillaria luteobubalina]
MSTSRTPAETNTSMRASTISIVSSTSMSESQKPSTTDSTHNHEVSDKTPSPTSTSSIPIQQIQSSTSTTSSITPESEITSTGLPPTHIGTTKESNTQSAGLWKIVGITVVFYLLLFFDSWWGFVRSVFTRRKRRGGMEDLQPDWEKQTLGVHSLYTAFTVERRAEVEEFVLPTSLTPEDLLPANAKKPSDRRRRVLAGRSTRM